MSQDHVLDKKWEFKRKDSELDSSSEDKGSSSARDQNQKQCNQHLSLVPAENEEQEVESSHHQELSPPKRAKARPNSTRKSKDKKIKKKSEKAGPRTAKTKRGRKTNGYKYNLTTALRGLETHVKVLVKEMNASREGFMKYMENELAKLVSGSSSGSRSKSAKKGKSKVAKKRGDPGNKTAKPKKISANDSARVALEQKKAWVSVQEARETEEVENVGKNPTVLELAGNRGRIPGMVLSTENPNREGRVSGMLATENPNRDFLATGYLGLPNLNPRPLAENYIVKASSSTLRVQPVVLATHRNNVSNVQPQTDVYYQGGILQQERESGYSIAGYDRSFSSSMSGSMGSLGGFPSTNNVGYKGGMNIHNLGLGGSESSAQENNFPSLRTMKIFGGNNGFQDSDMNNQLKY